MKLYFYRESQARDLLEAANDGAIHYVGEFANATKGDEMVLAAVKTGIAIACEACDMDEVARFVEVSTVADFYPLDKERNDA